MAQVGWRADTFLIETCAGGGDKAAKLERAADNYATDPSYEMKDFFTNASGRRYPGETSQFQLGLCTPGLALMDRGNIISRAGTTEITSSGRRVRLSNLSTGQLFCSPETQSLFYLRIWTPDFRRGLGSVWPPMTCP